MKKTFFTTKDDLEQIIRGKLSGVKATRQILTGWTNIVIEAETDSGSYFFRFPRNEFWSRMIRKDARFCQFVSGKTSFYTPDMKLLFDEHGRPFSLHKKIEGYSLNDRLYNLSHTALTAVAYDCAKFVYEMSKISVESAPKKLRYPLAKFLRELDERHYVEGEHIPEDHEFITSLGTSKLVHGDLNLGNILLDENDKMVAVIDFCFAGAGDPKADVARILSRPVPKEFEESLIRYYQELLGDDRREALEHLRESWGRIDAGYAGHIRREFPEITLPELQIT
ncbi:MAG: aminoglycoside phosphotransferase family protein [Candidatus Nomurabacteria bacterium]|nr:aminoglycoside phosphotransferase family protein [Candidatus Nomurabacteria bacterium]